MKKQGFSLIELMAALTITAIIAALAVPAYNSYITRSYLTEGFNGLSNYALAMQQYYQDQGSYANAGACGVATTATNHFGYACALSNADQSFTITATSNGTDGLTANGYVFTITDGNAQTTTAYTGAAVALPQNCWMTRAGGC